MNSLGFGAKVQRFWKKSRGQGQNTVVFDFVMVLPILSRARVIVPLSGSLLAVIPTFFALVIKDLLFTRLSSLTSCIFLLPLAVFSSSCTCFCERPAGSGKFLENEALMDFLKIFQLSFVKLASLFLRLRNSDSDSNLGGMVNKKGLILSSTIENGGKNQSESVSMSKSVAEDKNLEKAH